MNSFTYPSKKKLFSDMDSLEYYMYQIGSIQPLSSDEESNLAEKIQKGDHKALEKLVRANLRFVISVAKNYENQGMHLADLINEGNCGLIKAAKKFDGRKNFKFISYAVWWIRQSILKALAEQSRIVNLPLHVVTNITNIAKAKIAVEQKKQGHATVKDIAIELERNGYSSIKEEEIQALLRIGNRHVSLDQPVSDDKGDKGDVKLLDTLTDSEEAIDSRTVDLIKAEEISECLKWLKGNEGIVIRLYFGIGLDCNYTLDEIGQKLNLTRERVRQIKERALRRLKQYKRLEKFKDTQFQ